MTNNPRGPIIAGAIVGFILCGALGGFIDHQPFYGLVSVLFGAVGAGVGIFLGYKISNKTM
jgi:hypothetical protein